jgi:phosphohistidine phosphatase
MKILYLLRHAKSSWDDPGLADHDRPLASRGMTAAPLVGRQLKSMGARPDRVLCSTARRARETCDRVLTAMEAGDVPVERERGLYLCGHRLLLDRLRAVPDEAASLMLVAHNPDLQRLALRLTGSGDQALRAALAEKFPTGACLILRFDVERWQNIGTSDGHLVDFIRPRTLA